MLPCYVPVAYLSLITASLQGYSLHPLPKHTEIIILSAGTERLKIQNYHYYYYAQSKYTDYIDFRQLDLLNGVWIFMTLVGGDQ